MATCREVITSAYRKPNLRGRGEALEAAEADDGLTTLQSLYLEMVTLGAFGRLTDVIATENYTAGENERIRKGSYTVTLPATITDEETGEDRPPRDLALVVITGSTYEAHVFSAIEDAWQELTNLTLSDPAPLAERSFDGLVSLLAMRIAEENEKPVTPVLANAAQRFRGLITQQNDSARVTGQAEFY